MDTQPRITGSSSSLPKQLGMESEMARRIAAHNWTATGLGAIETWSDALSIAVDLCLGSRMCGCIYWGNEHLIIYNDAYSSILGTKHPWALGRRADEVWPEIFDIIGPLMERTFKAGETTGGDDVAIFLNRSGYVEEFYCSFSYTPLINHDGIIEGVFATLPETSVRVIGERRLRTLQQLGADAREARHPEQTLKIAAEVISRNPCDIPFGSLYSWRDDSTVAELAATANIDSGLPLSQPEIDLEGDGLFSESIRQALRDGHAVVPLDKQHQPIPLGAWKIPATELLVLPLLPYRDEVPNAAMLAGISPHKRLDEQHLGFFRMLADQINRSFAEAFGHEQEDLRVRELQQRARADQEAERLRIARDLHDTLLQSMQGMRFLLEAGVKQARSGERAALRLFEDALQASEHAIEEGREVLSLLRSTAADSRRIDTALTNLGKELVVGRETQFSFDIIGETRELNRDTWNDAYSICRESIANSVRHARASMIHVELEFGESFVVTIKDNGIGIDGRVAANGRAGHFGVTGMHERASNMNASLVINGSPNTGTVVELVVPSASAYVV